MLWGKKRQQIERLKCRVQQLEDIICPNRQHEYVLVGCDYVAANVPVYEYECVRCHRLEFDYIEPIVKCRRVSDDRNKD